MQQSVSRARSSFRLAPMSPLLRGITVFMLALPCAFVGAGAFGSTQLVVPGLILVALYGWVWLRFRPTRFVVSDDAIEVHWPLKQRRILRSSIKSAGVIDPAALRALSGFGMRIGVGGLWGGFGWLWTQRRGIAQMYVSRTTDGLVWIERGDERPWLITPENPAQFVRELGVPQV